MTERNTGILLDYSMLPIADPHAGITPERRLNVLSSSPSMHNLYLAEKTRTDRIAGNQLAARVEGWIRDQRIAGMEKRRADAQVKQIAA